MVRHFLALVLTAATLASCTDWGTGEVGRPVLLPAAPGTKAGTADVVSGSKTDTAIKTWETWSPPVADILVADADAFEGADSVFTPGDGAGSADAGPTDSAPLYDGGADAGADAVAADTGVPPIDGTIDGWCCGETWTAPDAWTGNDAGSGIETWVGADSWTGSDAGSKPDIAWDGAVIGDGWIYPSDVVAADTWTGADIGWDWDAGPQPDSGTSWDAWTTADAVPGWDAWIFDGTSTQDAWVYPDTWLSDLTQVDSADASDAEDANVGVDSNAPDWQGYPDLVVPPGVDINAGALASCSEMYLYQKEKCGPNASAECVAGMEQAGSVYANYRFAPLAECEKAVCSPMCAMVSNDKCLENCIGKYCANQFFSCIANGASGGANCADTFACSNKPDIQGKMWSIAKECIASATPVAQQQFAALIGCVTQPQTQTCIPLLAACYGNGSGTATCGQTLTCSGGCNGNDACSNACIGKASPSAVTLLDAVWNCVQTQCVPKCNGDKACQDQCMGAVCNKQLGACIAD